MRSQEMPGKEGGERELKPATRQELENDLRSMEELFNLREKRLDKMRRQMESQNLPKDRRWEDYEDLERFMALQEKTQGKITALRERIRRMKEEEEKGN